MNYEHWYLRLQRISYQRFVNQRIQKKIALPRTYCSFTPLRVQEWQAARSTRYRHSKSGHKDIVQKNSKTTLKILIHLEINRPRVSPPNLLYRYIFFIYTSPIKVRTF